MGLGTSISLAQVPMMERVTLTQIFTVGLEVRLLYATSRCKKKNTSCADHGMMQSHAGNAESLGPSPAHSSQHFGPTRRPSHTTSEPSMVQEQQNWLAERQPAVNAKGGRYTNIMEKRNHSSTHYPIVHCCTD